MENPVKEEITLSKCSNCGEIKHRIQNGLYPDGRNRIWVNEEGKKWVGRKCPECVVSKMKVRMQEFRSKDK